MMEASARAKERFCKDCNIPIRIFQEPYFTDRLTLYDKFYGTLEKWDIFLNELSKYHCEQDYFEEYNRVKDAAILDIKNTEAYQKFNEGDMNKYAVTHKNLPNKDIFKPSNDGKCFISIDMRKANFSSLHHYSLDIFGGADSWEEFIEKYTDNQHIINSKYIRQVILGNCNPKRHINFAGLLETMFEIERQYERLKNISIERINSEFCKIVASKQFCVELVLYPNVFSLFIPELKDLIGFQQNNPYHAYDVFDHTVHAIEKCESDDLVTRLAVFFHDFGKPHSYQDGEDGIRHFKGHGKVSAEITDSIMKRLRFDNETRNNVVELVYYHDATFEAGNKYIKRWLNKIGEKQFRRLLEVRKADIKGQKPDYEKSRIEKINNIEIILEEILQEQECFSLKDLAVNGNDVKKTMNLKEGEDVGYWLNEILKRVMDGELKNDRDALIYWMTGVTDGWIKK